VRLLSGILSIGSIIAFIAFFSVGGKHTISDRLVQGGTSMITETIDFYLESTKNPEMCLIFKDTDLEALKATSKIETTSGLVASTSDFSIALGDVSYTEGRTKFTIGGVKILLSVTVDAKKDSSSNEFLLVTIPDVEEYLSKYKLVVKNSTAEWDTDKLQLKFPIPVVLTKQVDAEKAFVSASATNALWAGAILLVLAIGAFVFQLRKKKPE